MDNVDVPSHDTHLKMLDCLIATVIQEKKPSCVTVHDPNKAMPEQHMVTFTHSPVSGKNLPKVQMEVQFITTCSPRSKGNGVDVKYPYIQPRYKIHIQASILPITRCYKTSPNDYHKLRKVLITMRKDQQTLLSL